MIFVVIWLVCAIACAILASNKGRRAGGWLLLGLLLGPIALILAAVVSNVKVEEREHAATQAQAAEMAATRKCPFCAERIKLEAVVCRYCGRDVPPVPKAAQGSASEAKRAEVRASAARGRVYIGILIVGAVVLVVYNLPRWVRGSGGDVSSPAASTPIALPAPSAPVAFSNSARTAPGTLAPELTYTVLSRKTHAMGKTLKIRLNRMATEAELSQIAVKLKPEEQGVAPRLFIWFFLPDTPAGSEDPAWATANFNPELRIDVRGLTRDELAQAAASTEKISKPLGRWIFNYGSESGPVVIAKVGGQWILTEQYKSYGTRTLTLRESKSRRGRLFTDVKGSDFGEYFLLLPDGGLEIGDKDGAIGTTTRLK